MHAGEWIALIMPGGAGIAAAMALIAKFTRLVDAVERLAGSMETITENVADHEVRITDLERSPDEGARRGRGG